VYPEDGLFGEEEGQEGDQSRRWVIDPIDGTKSYVSGVPLYATLLSFEVSGRAEIGVAFFPALDLMVYAERGGGAFANGRQISASAKTRVSDAVLCSGSVRTFEAQNRLKGYLSLGRECLAMRTWCDAYGHVLVAMGQVEAMIDPIVQPYDISALSVIVEEAGGRFSSFEGNADPSGEAISACPGIYSAIIGAFAE
jgi:histidinol-phosphatase